MLVQDISDRAGISVCISCDEMVLEYYCMFVSVFGFWSLRWCWCWSGIVVSVGSGDGSGGGGATAALAAP